MVVKVRRERKESSVSWCLVPFSRAPIICIDRALFQVKTRLNSAATGPCMGFLTRSARWSELRWIEGCKRQATDLLARDFHSLSLPTFGRYMVLPSMKTLNWLRMQKTFLPGHNSGKTRLVRGNASNTNHL